MSLYNAIFGVNPVAPIALACLDLTTSDVGRFRDAWIDDNGKIAIYTRNGGGNRECWENNGEGCDCTGCIMANVIPNLSHYSYDEDDDFDCTYATIYFDWPEEHREILAALAEHPVDSSRKWAVMLDDLKDGKRPEVVSALAQLVDAISSACTVEKS